MTPAAIIELITGLFQFPAALLALIRALKQTPEDKHAALVQKIQDEAAALASSGRPTWG